MASDSSPANIHRGPSSPDDSMSSPIGNTFSSPGDTRRRRGLRSSASYATPPPPRNSRFATPDATPTPSSRRGRKRRSPDLNSTPIAATPSSADEAPPSSEGGEFDNADEAPPMFVWGTNISVQDVNAAILRFLRNFREKDSNLEGKYMRSIHHVIEVEGESLEVDAQDVFDYDTDLYTKMVRYPLEVLAIFDIVLMDMVSRINPLFEKHIQARIYNLKASTSMRNLNPSDIEKMVSLKGMIIRCSSIIPEIREAIFRCLVCGYYSDPIVVDRGPVKEQLYTSMVPEKKPSQQDIPVTSQAQRDPGGTQNNQHNYDKVLTSSTKPKVKKKGSDLTLSSTGPDAKELQDAAVGGFCEMLGDLCSRAEILGDDHDESEWLSLPVAI